MVVDPRDVKNDYWLGIMLNIQKYLGKEVPSILPQIKNILKTQNDEVKEVYWI